MNPCPNSFVYLFSRHKISKEFFKGETFNKTEIEKGLLLWLPQNSVNNVSKLYPKSKNHKLFIMEDENAKLQVCEIDPSEIYYKELAIVPWDIVNSS